MSSMKQTITLSRYGQVSPMENVANPNLAITPQLPEGFVIKPEPAAPEPVRDLLSYLISLLPENINPVHVFLGIGIAFAGVTGGFIILQRLRRSNDSEVKDPAELPKLPYYNILGQLIEDDRLSNSGKPQGVLIKNQCPRGRKTPCIAPYPLKLETFLRVAGIKYDVYSNGIFHTQDNNNNSDSDDSKMIILDMEKIPDSQICMKSLSHKFDVNLSDHLSPTQKAIEQAFNHLLEQKIYWGISLYRWVYDGARSIHKIQYLPKSTRDSIPSVCRTVEHAAWHHGIGKKNATEVVEDLIRDVEALSIQLGTKKYLLSDLKPTELDCTAFAMLSQMLWTMDGPFYVAVNETYKNLNEFCWRMRREFWPDWNDCLDTSANLK